MSNDSVLQFKNVDTSERLDSFLSSRLKQLSRRAVSELISRGGVSIAGRLRLKPSIRLKPHEEVLIDKAQLDKLVTQIKEQRGLSSFSQSGDQKVIIPQNLPLDIVFEDEEVLVVDKPAGQVIHPSAGARKDTLANAVAGYFKKKGLPLPHRVGLVHRLDKDVSGIVIIGKTARAQAALAAQFDSTGIGPESSDEVLCWKAHKYYQAIVDCPRDAILGKLGLKEGGGFVRVEGYIRRSTRNRKKFEFSAGRRGFLTGDTGRYSRSYVRIIRKLDENRYLLEVLLVTGRTHQIRVQLSTLDLPISGDTLYGGSASRLDKLCSGGICLRSCKLCYIPPLVYDAGRDSILISGMDSGTEGRIEDWQCLSGVRQLLAMKCTCSTAGRTGSKLPCEMKRKVVEIPGLI